MRCADCLELLQRSLDGESAAGGAECELHLANCPACQEWFAAARRLEEGLRVLRAQISEPGPSERIVALVLRDHALRRRRRWRAGWAAAAAVALAVGLGLWRGHYTDTGPELPPAAPVLASEEPSLQRQVAEVGSALADLARRTTQEAVGPTRLFVPEPVPTPRLSNVTLVSQAWEPPKQSLRDVGAGVSAGLEPVTTSFRRAVDLFLRDLPVSPDNPTGL
ncbi:MAG: zf-HC2 domain-containing protein [Gemmataceae bacterium]|nr:zf-HC2 domain-containing protein [Gemmataceae bacterium]MDW8266771.1 hypothetical protein [Gemmataceae bacterium]